MAEPQDAIFQEDGSHHHWLEFDLLPGTSVDALRAALREALADPPDVTPDRVPRRVVAFGPVVWSRLAPDRVPPGLNLFEGLDGPAGHHAPATPHGLWVWLHGAHADENLAAALALHRALRPVARLAAEERGVRFRDGRDLTGFAYGAGNPTGAARLEVACVPRGRGAGGSHVLVQRWVHDLARFEALTDGQREKVVGRRLADGERLSRRSLPADAHVARAAGDGVEPALYRRSVPFGGARENGLYLVAFARESAPFDDVLRRMFGVDDGVHDRLLEFSRPTSGAYYFAPSREDLDAVLA